MRIAIDKSLADLTAEERRSLLDRRPSEEAGLREVVREILEEVRAVQFAFEGGPENPHLPHNLPANSVVYTGTHDNDTTLGWFQSCPPQMQAHIREYLGGFSDELPWPLIRAAFASHARLAVVPLQDLLMLGSEHRMNRPGVTAGNWSWRFSWDQVPESLGRRVQKLVHIYGRGQGAPDADEADSV